MATREQRASARGTIAGREPDRDETTAEAAVASAASVPWAPAGIVYAHQDDPGADEATGLEAGDTDDFNDDVPSRPSRLRRAIPLLWAAALTVAALQHAGEVERRAALREPSPAELDMQDRAQGEIKAAWRSMGAVTAVTERTPAVVVAGDKPILGPVEEKPTTMVPESKPAATAVEEKPILAQAEEKPITIVAESKPAATAVEKKPAVARVKEEPVDAVVAVKGEPVVAKALPERVKAEDTPSDRQKAEHALVEPITEAARVTTNSGTADAPVKGADKPAKDEVAKAVAAKGSQEETTPEVAHLPPSTGEATKADPKGRHTASRASRHRAAHAERARTKHTQVSSSKYVAFDGHGPRYFTIERPSRMAP